MAWTTEQQQQVAAAVMARREVLGLSQAAAVAQAGGGVSLPVWSLIENARQGTYKRRTILAVCRALGWSADSIDRLLNGTQPEVVTQPGDGHAVGLSELLAAVRELSGRLDQLSATVAELAAEPPSARQSPARVAPTKRGSS